MIMKKYIILLVATTLGLAACKKELKEIGAPASKVEGIMADWDLLKATQVDELSLTKESANIYSFLAGSGKLPNISFSDSTYSVDTVGLKFNFFGGPSGKWRFDNPALPAKITFMPDGADAFTLKLNGPIRPQDNLRLSKEVILNCKAKDNLLMSYVLEFKRK